MKIQKGKYERNRVWETNNFLFSVLLIGIIIFFLVLIIGSLREVSSDTEPPENGDWIIKEGENAKLTKNHTMNGNVIIDGNLTIDNYTLEFDCDMLAEPPKAYALIVNKTGKLILKNNAKIKAKVGEEKDKRMSDITIFGNANIQNCEIEGLTFGVICEENCSVSISNTTFRNCGVGIVAIGFLAQKETNEFINVDFDIIQYWKVVVKVINERDKIVTKGKVNLTSSYGNFSKRKIDENGTADFGYVKVKEGNFDYNPFIIRAGTHEDEENKTPHLTHESVFNINENYVENPKIIKINNTLSPDLSIRLFSCNLSFMEVGKKNRLNVWIRNMGEKSANAEIKFYAKLEGEESYEIIDTIKDEIPASTTPPHYIVGCNWKPEEGGNYNLSVEIIPLKGIDPYPYDDNSPYNSIKVNVLEPPKIEIKKINGKEINEYTKVSGYIIIEGAFSGSVDRIFVWINNKRWEQIFNLELDYEKYLKYRNLSNELKTAFLENNYELSSIAYILEINKNTWEIVDIKKYYKIEKTQKELKVYLGLFAMPYKIDYKENRWYCKLDTGAFTGTNHKIFANISGEGNLFYDECFIKVNLDNSPKIKINAPKNGKVLSAIQENDEKYVGGVAWKVSPLAPNIENIDLMIDGKYRNVIVEIKNETYLKWYYYWNINKVKDGNYLIKVQCVDKEQRASKIVEINVTVDNSAKYSIATLPRISIITKEPNVVNEKILIMGSAEDDYIIKKIEAKIDVGNWKTIIDDINKNSFDWKYTWYVNELDKGRHTIYFRAVDEEKDESIIDKYYPIVSFNITKTIAILPDLSIESIIIKNKYWEKVKKVRNYDNLTFEVNVKVARAYKILSPTIIYVRITNNKITIGSGEKTIDESISDIFTVTIPWTVYGEKGIYNFTVQIDVGNYVEEQNEFNNIKTFEIEILDNPQTKPPQKEERVLKSNIGAIIFSVIILTLLILIFFLIYYKRLGKEKI